MFVAIIIYLVQAVIMGFVALHISESKGYEGGFAWGFWLGIVGVLVVGFRPTLQAQTYSEHYGSLSNASANADSAMWDCMCGATNSGALDYCTSCRRSRSEAERGKIRCPHCGAVNSVTSEVCFACNKPLTEQAAARMALASGAYAIDAEAPGAAGSAAGADGSKREVIEMIDMLAKLHGEGVLTDDEFSEKKAELLSRI